MATLISNMPAEEVWVRKEYLTDFKSGHGEFTRGVWVSCKSMPGRAAMARFRGAPRLRHPSGEP